MQGCLLLASHSHSHTPTLSVSSFIWITGGKPRSTHFFLSLSSLSLFTTVLFLLSTYNMSSMDSLVLHTIRLSLQRQDNNNNSNSKAPSSVLSAQDYSQKTIARILQLKTWPKRRRSCGCGCEPKLRTDDLLSLFYHAGKK